MNLAWLTDIHLNFLKENNRQKFYQEIANTRCDAVLISGDIAEAPSVASLLTEMAEAVNKPIYFVLGNHDYYRGDIDTVKNAMTALTKENNKLFWLPAAGIHHLGNNIILLGQDGWADGRLGDYANSTISLNDSRMIADLFQAKVMGKFQLLEKMQQLADIDALQLQQDMLWAINQHPKKVIVLTHVPPFKETCMHQGEVSDDNWLPYFSSKATGDVLMTLAKNNPLIDFLVLCGHTHSTASYQAFKNLNVEVGCAEYYAPKIQKIIAI
jgi:predicted MPP superfamily phosphohydrolase